MKQGAEGAQGKESQRNVKCAGLHVLLSVGALLYFSLLIQEENQLLLLVCFRLGLRVCVI